MPRLKNVVTWIEQKEGGCGMAALAMLLDMTYVRVCLLGKNFCGNCGIEEEDFDQFLAEHDFSVQRRWRARSFDGTKHEVWPPKPWAARHVALVRQVTDDEDLHYVVMDRRGVVYDPADSEFKPSRLDRYHEVQWVAAVYPARKRKQLPSGSGTNAV